MRTTDVIRALREPRAKRPIAGRFAFLLVAAFSLLLGSCSYSSTFVRTDLAPGTTITEERDYIAVLPTDAKQTSVLFYPGGLVDPHAYIPLVDGLAAAGYPAYIVKMPLNLAVLAQNKGLRVIGEIGGQSGNNAPPASTTAGKWVIVGHSLGGAMAASVVAGNPDRFAGIVFLASYPPKSVDLSNLSIAVLSLYGSDDLVADREKVTGAMSQYPAGAMLTEIAGGNHAGFGDYGPQRGDGTATITRKQQQQEAVDDILRFIDNL